MKTVTVPLICYSCNKEFGFVEFSANIVGDVPKVKQLYRNGEDAFDIKFTCCEACANRLYEDRGRIAI